MVENYQLPKGAAGKAYDIVYSALSKITDVYRTYASQPQLADYRHLQLRTADPADYC